MSHRLRPRLDYVYNSSPVAITYSPSDIWINVASQLGGAYLRLCAFPPQWSASLPAGCDSFSGSVHTGATQDWWGGYEAWSPLGIVCVTKGPMFRTQTAMFLHFPSGVTEIGSGLWRLPIARQVRCGGPMLAEAGLSFRKKKENAEIFNYAHILF